MVSLTDITGVGSKTADTLKENGITTVDELAVAEPSDINGVSEAKAIKIVRRATQETITTKTAADLLDEFNSQTYASTGIGELDEAMSGGWEAETIGLVYGKSDTGKTQVIFSSMGETAAEGTVVYLMTELQSKSIAERLRSLSREVDHLDNIHIYEAFDVDEQYECYHAIEEDHEHIDLLVIDSFTAQFRMTDRFDGRENYGERSAEMGRHLRKLGKVARVYQTPVVLTGQVYATPDAFGKGDNPWGGEKMLHFVSYYLRMSEGEGTLKKATVENHPGIEETTLRLRIEDEEIVAVREP